MVMENIEDSKENVNIYIEFVLKNSCNGRKVLDSIELKKDILTGEFLDIIQDIKLDLGSKGFMRGCEWIPKAVKDFEEQGKMTTPKCFNCLHSHMNILFGIAYHVCEKHGLLTPYDESLRDCEDFKSKTGNFEPSDEFIKKLLNECEGILPDCELWDTPEKMKAVAKDVLSDYDKESDYIKGLKHEMGVDDDNT